MGDDYRNRVYLVLSCNLVGWRGGMVLLDRYPGLLLVSVIILKRLRSFAFQVSVELFLYLLASGGTFLVTVSRKKTPKAASVTDESTLPSKYFTVQDPVLDRKQLLADLRENDSLPAELRQAIPGAELLPQGISLTMRVK